MDLRKTHSKQANQLAKTINKSQNNNICMHVPWTSSKLLLDL
jgi:hypothetical protein